MIVFDLCCARGGHRFEAWFASSESFADQKMKGLIGCPVCGDSDISKAVMAPRIGAKSNQKVVQVPARQDDMSSPGAIPAELVRKVIAEIAARQAEMLPHSQWVGRDFADAARAMHEGRSPESLIHGQASPHEAQALRDDGIAAMPLLVPIAPPDAVN